MGLFRIQVNLFHGTKGAEYLFSAGRDNSIELSFSTTARTDGQAIRGVAKSIQSSELSWVKPKGETWLIDLDELKRLIPRLESIDWLAGEVRVHPQFEPDEEIGRGFASTSRGRVVCQVDETVVQDSRHRDSFVPLRQGVSPMEKRYQVFISSTFVDLQAERQHVTHALLALRCIPSGMEIFPASDDDQWTLIKRVIEDCDYYLVIIGGRYGSTDKDGKGYTEKEYDYAIKLRKPVIAFLHANPGSLTFDKSEQDSDKREKLREFRAKAERKMIQRWNSPEDLAVKVSTSLTHLMKSHPAEGWVKARYATDSEEVEKLRARVAELENALEGARSGPTPIEPALPEEAVALLKEAASSNVPRIFAKGNLSGYRIRAGNFDYDGAESRKVARFQEAVRRLMNAGFITEITEGMFELTAAGFEYLEDSKDPTA
jgi:hypothetical protein